MSNSNKLNYVLCKISYFLYVCLSLCSISVSQLLETYFAFNLSQTH